MLFCHTYIYIIYCIQLVCFCNGTSNINTRSIPQYYSIYPYIHEIEPIISCDCICCNYTCKCIHVYMYMYMYVCACQVTRFEKSMWCHVTGFEKSMWCHVTGFKRSMWCHVTVAMVSNRSGRDWGRGSDARSVHLHGVTTGKLIDTCTYM